MTNENFSAEQSLRVIQTMIEKTRQGISDKSHYFLLWGWAVMIACLGQFILISVLHSPYHYHVWWITIVCVLVNIVFMRRDRKSTKVRSYVSEHLAMLWIGLGISFFILSMIFIKLGWLNCFPFFIMLYGLGTFVSGRILQFNAFVVGGALCWLIAAVSAWFPFAYQMLFTSLAVLVSYIIPGYMLRAKYRLVD